MIAPSRPRWEAGAIVAAALGILLVFSGVGVAVVNRQPILDRLTAASFTASPTLRGYERSTTMTAQGRMLFEASRPEIEPTASFNASCGASPEGSGVLGCYQPLGKRILLFDVTDRRLDGLEQSVAAHEMLHAAWDRMSDSDRAALRVPLEAEARARAKNPAFAALLTAYAKEEPGERLNELHSILGTQVVSLPPSLARHYAQYFSDRRAVASMYVNATAVLVGIQAQATQLAAQLTALKETIDNEYAGYTRGYDALDSEIVTFNRRAKSGSISSQKVFDRDRAALLKRRDDLDALYARIQGEKATWDATHAQLESVNSDAAELNENVNIAPYSGDEPG